MDRRRDPELEALLVQRGLAGDRLEAVVDLVALSSADPTSLGDRAVAEAVQAHQRVAASVAALGHPLLTRFEAGAAWALDGARSPAAWIQTHTPTSRKRANAQLGVARALLACPLVAAATAELGEEKTRLLVGARTPATEAAFARDESWLVEQARRLTVEALRILLAHWRFRADPDGSAPRCDRASTISLAPVGDDGFALSGHLTTLDAATVMDAIEARIDAWHRAGLLVGDTRTRGQLRAAALAELCAADEALPVRRRPTVLVVSHPDGSGAGPSSTPGHGPLHPETAARLACSADLHRVVWAPGREVLEVGMAARLATPAQWRALIVRSGGHCEYPGCDAPHQWCQAHHLDPFRPNPDDPDGGTGPTDLANLTSLQYAHQRRALLPRRRAT